LESETKNLLIILGPTCTGKSATAIIVAKAFDGEIINCDSMQVYRGFDIGTDKLLSEQQENIPHHLLDIFDPSRQFTAADFVRLACQACTAIASRGRLPIISGGTGLYLKALMNGLFPEGKRNTRIRRELENEAEERGLQQLAKELEVIDPDYLTKIGPRDKIRIIRALEVYRATGKPISEHFAHTNSQIQDFHLVRIGLELERVVLYKKIEDRVDRMFERGLVQEVKSLLERGIRENSPPFRALGYKHVLMFLRGETSLEEAIELTKKDTRHYAKRQITWFRKMENIHWFDPGDIEAIKEFIAENLR
jgi:tRNA dimethylallyltransferase